MPGYFGIKANTHVNNLDLFSFGFESLYFCRIPDNDITELSHKYAKYIFEKKCDLVGLITGSDSK